MAGSLNIAYEKEISKNISYVAAAPSEFHQKAKYVESLNVFSSIAKFEAK